jgi:hypothetical protein
MINEISKLLKLSTEFSVLVDKVGVLNLKGLTVGVDYLLV